MNREDSVTLAIATVITVLLCGVMFVTVSKWHLGTEVITTTPIVKTKLVEVPTSEVKYLYVTSPVPSVPGGVVAVPETSLKNCPAALDAADEIINSINLGQDPTPWITEYQKQRSKCGG